MTKKLEETLKALEAEETLDVNQPQGVLDTTRADLFKEVIKPDFQKEESMNIKTPGGEVNPFTKELRTSMIDKRQLEIVAELTDLAAMAGNIGALGCSKMLLAHRDTILAAAPSLKAALLKLMNTEYSIKKIDVAGKGRSMLKRGDDSDG